MERRRTIPRIMIPGGCDALYYAILDDECYMIVQDHTIVLGFRMIAFSSTLPTRTERPLYSLIQAALPDCDSIVAFWDHPILSDDIPNRDVVPREVEVYFLRLPWFEIQPAQHKQMSACSDPHIAFELGGD